MLSGISTLSKCVQLENELLLIVVNLVQLFNLALTKLKNLKNASEPMITKFVQLFKFTLVRFSQL